MTAELQIALAQLKDNPTYRVWGYVRVSSEKQREGESPEAQKEHIEKYCKDNGLSTPVIVYETASSTKPMFNLNLESGKQERSEMPRPILLLLLNHISDIEYGHLVVWKLDRLSRSLSDQEMMLRSLWNKGAKVHSTAFDERNVLEKPEDPQRVLFRQILGAFAQYEAACIKARLQVGILHKGARGGYWGGRPPFGYVAKNHELEIVPQEGSIVCYVFYLRQVAKMSYKSISDHLQATLPGVERLSYWPMQIKRMIGREKLYKGYLADKDGNLHFRKDLQILPDTKDALKEMIEEPCDERDPTDH